MIRATRNPPGPFPEMPERAKEIGQKSPSDETNAEENLIKGEIYIEDHQVHGEISTFTAPKKFCTRKKFIRAIILLALCIGVIMAVALLLQVVLSR